MPTSLLSLDAAKEHLHLLSASAGLDAELQTVIDAASRIVQSRCGPVDPATHVERFASGFGRDVLVLRYTQVTAVTSAVDDNGVTVGGVFTLDPDAGLVRSTIPFPYGPFTVTYTVGRAVPPPALVVACKVITAHLWQTAVSDPGTPGAGYLVPYRAESLMDSYRVTAGIA